ncbi:MAG: hypothetical protein JWN65_2720 [Solirubrobacterales bacterium]|nr:hypothetical protein [Solirubrobacterales bacterium]
MNRLILTVVLALVAASTSTSPVFGHYANSKSYRCPYVPALDSSGADDYGAFDVRERGTSCDIARRLIEDYYYREAHDGLTIHGVLLKYKCQSRLHRRGLTHRDLRCTRGTRKVITAALG